MSARGGARPPAAEEGGPRGRGAATAAAATLAEAEVATPLGPLRVARSEAGARAIAYPERWEIVCEHLQRHGGVFRLVPDRPKEIEAALESYFAGDADALAGLPIAAPGTPFQRAVWRALRSIPAGEVRSYADVARAAGAPGAARAAGAAVGANPVTIAVPCHRVLAAGGLGGYAGGLDRKRWLLAHEGAPITPPGGGPASSPRARRRASPRSGRAGGSRCPAR